MITKDQLLNIFPMSRNIIDDFVDPLNETMKDNDILTPRRMASFLAQTGHESTGFLRTVENLNYSADGLLKIFSKYFTPSDAKLCARKPELIANRVYANRNGNGNEASGDGWKYRGRGIVQCTGKANYKACSIALYDDERLLDTPDLLEAPFDACRSAGWFWETHNLNKFADLGDVISVTKVINGGLNGYDDRLALYNKALKVIGGD